MKNFYEKKENANKEHVLKSDDCFNTVGHCKKSGGLIANVVCNVLRRCKEGVFHLMHGIRYRTIASMRMIAKGLSVVFGLNKSIDALANTFQLCIKKGITTGAIYAGKMCSFMEKILHFHVKYMSHSIAALSVAWKRICEIFPTSMVSLLKLYEKFLRKFFFSAEWLALILTTVIERSMSFCSMAIHIVGQIFRKSPRWSVYCLITPVKKSFIAVKLLFSGIIKITNTTLKYTFLGVKNTILSPFLLTHYMIRKIYGGVRSVLSKIRNTITFVTKYVLNSINTGLSFLKQQLLIGMRQIFTTATRPMSIISLAASVVICISVKAYDSQIMKVQYCQALFKTKREKALLKSQRRAALNHSKLNEYSSSRSKISKNETSEMFSAKNAVDEERKWAKSSSEFKDIVERFFLKNKVSEVLCASDSCKIKIGDKIFDKYCAINDPSWAAEIFIAESDGDRILFADASGHTYAKEISSFFEK